MNESINNSTVDHDYTDLDLREFLDALDGATFSVSPWESDFLESTIARKEFSPKQREAIHRMIEKYASRLNW